MSPNLYRTISSLPRAEASFLGLIKPSLSSIRSTLYPPHLVAPRLRRIMSTSSNISHPLLNDFKNNKPSLGAWLMMPGFWHARTVAESHPDLNWILIDLEHGISSAISGASETVAAIHGATRPGRGPGGPSAIVRIPATGVSESTSWQIKNALDSGARGVLVPMVSTAEKAKEIVQDSRFPPLGRRGFGSPFAPMNWGTDIGTYFRGANENILVMVQIETKEGYENVEEIAQVEGLDALLIGPNDLSISLGYGPAIQIHPEVEKAIQRILEVGRKYNKKVAIFCSSGQQSAQRVKEGFDMINVLIDITVLQAGVKREIDAALGSG